MYITFLPSGRRARVKKGETILQAAKRTGVPIESACSGTRCCGLCRVHVLPEKPSKRWDDEPLVAPSDRRERSALSPEERLDGWHLACMTKPVASIRVEVPKPKKQRLIPTATGEKLPVFDCNHAGSEEIPAFVIRKFGASYWDAYQYAPLMSAASALIADSNGDEVCKLPFCVTIEAGAFGAEISYPENGVLPLPGQPMIQRIEDLDTLGDIDFSQGRIAEVLEAVRLLHAVGRRCVLKVEAPFTVLSMLMDSLVLFRAVRKDRPRVDAALAKIRKNLVEYIRRAFLAGADIISYADPSGVVEFVGPKVFRDVSGRETIRLLRDVQTIRPGGIIHICGKTSTSLEYMGLATSETYELPEPRATFAHALLSIHDRRKIQVTGHNCILVTAAPIPHQRISFLSLAEDA